MIQTLLGALLLPALPTVFAFGNTSPFFIVSTADLHLPAAHDVLADAATLTAGLLTALEDCPTRSYLILEQHSISVQDFADASSAPQLSRLMSSESPHVKTASITFDVLGEIDTAAIKKHLHTHCPDRHVHANSTASAWLHSHVLRDLAAPLDQVHRKELLLQYDAHMGDYISDPAKEQDFTILFTTSPQILAQPEATVERYHYESSFVNSMQMELKRDLSSHIKPSNGSKGDLFERYQYFTPGLFMGISSIVPLVLILLVGIRAVTNLEVSYSAFSKEMGHKSANRS